MAADRTTLDDTDRAILYYLQTNARSTTNAEISDEIGVSATTVGQRLDNLRDDGIIKTYTTMVDYETAGFPHRVLLFCTVPSDARRELANELLETHGVISVREMITGEHNLHVELVAPTRTQIVESITAVENHGVTVADSEMMKNELREPFDDFHPEQID